MLRSVILSQKSVSAQAFSVHVAIRSKFANVGFKTENIGLKAKVNLLEKEKAELEKRNRKLEIKVCKG